MIGLHSNILLASSRRMIHKHASRRSWSSQIRRVVRSFAALAVRTPIILRRSLSEAAEKVAASNGCHKHSSFFQTASSKRPSPRTPPPLPKIPRCHRSGILPQSTLRAPGSGLNHGKRGFLGILRVVPRKTVIRGFDSLLLLNLSQLK